MIAVRLRGKLSKFLRAPFVDLGPPALDAAAYGVGAALQADQHVLERAPRSRRRSPRSTRDVLVDRRAVDIDVDLVRTRARRRRAGRSPGRRSARRCRRSRRSRSSPCWPRRCRACRACRASAGRTAGKAPRPISVEVTARRSACASSRSSFARAPARVDHPAAGVEDRPLGLRRAFRPHPRSAPRRPRLRADSACGAAPASAIGAVRDLDVLGNVDHHRARAARGGDVERLVDRRGEVGRVLHQIVVLGAVAGDADRVGLLEGVGADQGRSGPGR